MATLSFTAVIAMLAGCSKQDDLPTVIADRTVCSNCKMLVSETLHATAFKVGDDYRIFDDLGCMLATLQSEPTLNPTKVLVQDQLAGKWLDASATYFVRSPKFKTPMGYGYLSFETKQHADEASRKVDGKILNGLSELKAYNEKEHAQQ
jgi:copper chaperone NosL